MKTAIYPGTFDPVTYGHLDILQRATTLFDKIIVAVASETNKDTLFSLEERVELWRHEVTSDPRYSNVIVTTFSGLTIEFARQNHAVALIRGLRAISDFEYEFQLALMNKNMAPDIETVFLMTQSQFSFISSTTIKLVSSLEGCVGDFVPAHVEQLLKSKYLLRSASAKN
ncbi:MAG: pantetheine-phosphate adenylyltransferase [Peptococcaceae bacterium]|nr:pantetheine-phosphate adenylyltransferase [Peptococcaceae bacterium]